MEKQLVYSKNAPTPLGPYSQGVRYAGLVFVSGQGPVDPSTGKVVEGGIEKQVERTLENVKEVLKAGGSSMEAVLKVTVYLKNPEHFKQMNEVYSKFFPVNPPARATVVASMVSPSWLVEIDAVGSVTQ
ncbi:MAG: RidA family protein [Thermoprotei archaeon]